MQFTFNVYQDGSTWAAHCPELDVYSVGSSHDQVLYRIRKIVEFYVDTYQEQLHAQIAGMKKGVDNEDRVN